jgi:hypothetical protein
MRFLSSLYRTEELQVKKSTSRQHPQLIHEGSARVIFPPFIFKSDSAWLALTGKVEASTQICIRRLLLIRLFQQTASLRGEDSSLAQHMVLC